MMFKLTTSYVCVCVVIWLVNRWPAGFLKTVMNILEMCQRLHFRRIILSRILLRSSRVEEESHRQKEIFDNGSFNFLPTLPISGGGFYPSPITLVPSSMSVSFLSPSSHRHKRAHTLSVLLVVTFDSSIISAICSVFQNNIFGYFLAISFFFFHRSKSLKNLFANVFDLIDQLL